MVDRGNSAQNSGNFWSPTGISGIVKNVFKCGCGSRGTKEEKVSSLHPFYHDDDFDDTPTPKYGEFEIGGVNFRIKEGLKQKFMILPSSNSPKASTQTPQPTIRKKPKSETKAKPETKAPQTIEPNKTMTMNETQAFPQIEEEKKELPPLPQKSAEKLASASKKIEKSSKENILAKVKVVKPRKLWQPEEDKLLLHYYKELGPAWADISKNMGGIRSGKQIRDRYMNKLDPSLINTDWTEQEDQMLISLYEKFGKKWREISKNLPGRSESMIKNRVKWRFKWMLEGDKEESDQFQSPSGISVPNDMISDRDLAMNNHQMVAEPQYSENVISHFSQNGDLEKDMRPEPDPPVYGFQYQKNIQPQESMQIMAPISQYQAFPQDAPVNDFRYMSQNIFQENPPVHNNSMMQFEQYPVERAFNQQAAMEKIVKRKSEKFGNKRQPFDPSLNSKLERDQFDDDDNGYDTPFIDFNETNHPPTGDQLGLWQFPSNLNSNNLNMDFEDNGTKQEAIIFHEASHHMMEQPQFEPLDEIDEQTPKDLSREEAAHRVVVLRQRLSDLESLLKITYDQISKASGP